MTNRRARREAKRLGNNSSPTLYDRLMSLGPCPDYEGVHTVEAAAVIAKSRVEWQRTRASILDQQARRGRISDPALTQERHSPTVEVAVDDPASTRHVRRNVTRVRASEAWRHNRLSDMQRQAEAEISAAWLAQTGALAIRGSSLSLLSLGVVVSGGGDGEGDSARLAALESNWRAFVTGTQRGPISLGLFLAVLTTPCTLTQIERDFRLKAGAAFFNYACGLDLWCVLRGWARPGIGNLSGCG